MPLKIRRATPKEIPELSKLYFEEFSAIDKEWTLGSAKSRVKQALRISPKWSFIIELDGAAIGLVFAQDFNYAPGKCLLLTEVCVRSGYQNRGYGHKALAILIKKAKKLGYKYIYLTAVRTKTALSLYRKSGFMPVKDFMELERKL